MYKLDLALNNNQVLICHKTSQTRQVEFFKFFFTAGGGGRFLLPVPETGDHSPLN